MHDKLWRSQFSTKKNDWIKNDFFRNRMTFSAAENPTMKLLT